MRHPFYTNLWLTCFLCSLLSPYRAGAAEHVQPKGGGSVVKNPSRPVYGKELPDQSFEGVPGDLYVVTSKPEQRSPGRPPKAKALRDAIKSGEIAGPLTTETSVELWVPEGVEKIRAAMLSFRYNQGVSVFHLTPWREFAVRNDCALILLGERVNGRDNDKTLFPDGGEGFGPGVRAALELAADLVKEHPELRHLPLVPWGMSAGGQWAYEYATWDPEHSLGFIRWGKTNPGLPSNEYRETKTTLEVPGLHYKGQWEDKITSYYEHYQHARKCDVPRAWAWERNVGHNYTYLDTELSIAWVEAILDLRVPPNVDSAAGPVKFQPIDRRQGWLGVLGYLDRYQGPDAYKILPAAEYHGDLQQTAWLPNEKVARLWLKYCTFDGKQTPKASAMAARVQELKDKGSRDPVAEALSALENTSPRGREDQKKWKEVKQSLDP